MKSQSRASRWQRKGAFLMPFVVLILLSACGLHSGAPNPNPSLQVAPTAAILPTGVAANNPRWQPVKTGLPDDWICNLVIDPRAPTTIYTATSSNGLFKTTDGGQNWSAIQTGLPDSTYSSPCTLAISPQDTSTLYASVSTGYPGATEGLFKSTDGGSHWNTAYSDEPLPYGIYELMIDPVTPTTLYGCAGGSIYKSIDGGATWETASFGLPTYTSMISLAINPAMPTTLYTGTIGQDEYGPSGRIGKLPGDLFKSADGGKTWQAVHVNPAIDDVMSIAIDPLTPTTMYVGTDQGVYKSVDGGVSWNSFSKGLDPIDTYELEIDPQTPTTLYARTNEGGIYKSTDGAESWVPFNDGLGNEKHDSPRI